MLVRAAPCAKMLQRSSVRKRSELIRMRGRRPSLAIRRVLGQLAAAFRTAFVTSLTPSTSHTESVRLRTHELVCS